MRIAPCRLYERRDGTSPASPGMAGMPLRDIGNEGRARPARGLQLMDRTHSLVIYAPVRIPRGLRAGRPCTMAALAPPLHARGCRCICTEVNGKLPGGYIDGSLLPRAARGPAGREPQRIPSPSLRFRFSSTSPSTASSSSAAPAPYTTPAPMPPVAGRAAPFSLPTVKAAT